MDETLKSSQEDKSTVERILEKKNKFFESLPHEEKGKLLLEAWSRSVYLKAKYPDFQSRQVWHIITGSSEEVSNKEDFPGEDSVETFFDSLIQKYSR